MNNQTLMEYGQRIRQLMAEGKEQEAVELSRFATGLNNTHELRRLEEGAVKVMDVFMFQAEIPGKEMVALRLHVAPGTPAYDAVLATIKEHFPLTREPTEE